MDASGKLKRKATDILSKEKGIDEEEGLKALVKSDDEEDEEESDDEGLTEEGKAYKNLMKKRDEDDLDKESDENEKDGRLFFLY